MTRCTLQKISNRKQIALRRFVIVDYIKIESGAFFKPLGNSQEGRMDVLVDSRQPGRTVSVEICTVIF